MVNITLSYLEDQYSKKKYPEGYYNYIQGAKYNYVQNEDPDGYLSLCLDARLPISELFRKFNNRIPISSAGNALPEQLKSKFLFEGNNVIVCHGVLPEQNQIQTQPKCSGHQFALDYAMANQSDNQKTKEFEWVSKILTSLEPFIAHDEQGYDYQATTKNLSKEWHAETNSWFYDHTRGWIYDVNDYLSPQYLGVMPSLFFSGVNPKEGQNPSLIIINTSNKPYFSFTKGTKAKEIGGVAEIFFPDSQFPEIIVQSVIFCIKNHLENKGINGGHFSSSELILFIGEDKQDLHDSVKSILTSKHQTNKDYFMSFTRDPKDIIMGLIPTEDKEQLFEIKIK